MSRPYIAATLFHACVKSNCILLREVEVLQFQEEIKISSDTVAAATATKDMVATTRDFILTTMCGGCITVSNSWPQGLHNHRPSTPLTPVTVAAVVIIPAASARARTVGIVVRIKSRVVATISLVAVAAATVSPSCHLYFFLKLKNLDLAEQDAVALYACVKYVIDRIVRCSNIRTWHCLMQRSKVAWVVALIVCGMWACSLLSFCAKRFNLDI